MTKLLDKRQAAEFLNVSVRAIDYFRQSAGLPAHIIGGKLVRFDARELERWALGRNTDDDTDSNDNDNNNEQEKTK